jgi:hypothetical protein
MAGPSHLLEMQANFGTFDFWKMSFMSSHLIGRLSKFSFENIFL